MRKSTNHNYKSPPPTTSSTNSPFQHTSFRIEIDDSRRQVSVIGDLQTAMAELNGNQKELASAVGGLQQSSIYISEWVQTLRGEAAELRALVTNVQQEQQRGSMALAR